MKKIFKNSYIFIYLLILYVIAYLLLVFVGSIVKFINENDGWFAEQVEVIRYILCSIKRKMRSLFGKQN